MREFIFYLRPKYFACHLCEKSSPHTHIHSGYRGFNGRARRHLLSLAAVSYCMTSGRARGALKNKIRRFYMDARQHEITLLRLDNKMRRKNAKALAKIGSRKTKTSSCGLFFVFNFPLLARLRAARAVSACWLCKNYDLQRAL